MNEKLIKPGIILMFVLFLTVYLNRESSDPQVANTETDFADSQSQREDNLNIKYYPGTIFSNEFDTPSSPKKDMKFSSKETVEKLRLIYKEIEFYGEYKEGDLSLYDSYAEKFTRLLKNEIQYYDPLSDTYEYVSSTYEPHDFKQGAAHCYLFDMNEDGKPELFMRGVRGAYVFQYIPESDQCVVWWKGGGGNIWAMGSRKVDQFSLDDSYVFTQLSKSGEKEFDIIMAEHVVVVGAERVFAVTLPSYEAGYRETDIIDEMIEDGYFEDWDNGNGNCYFRLTEEEYLEVTEPYRKAVELAKKERQPYVFVPWEDW